jgi:hypothetical protein
MVWQQATYLGFPFEQLIGWSPKVRSRAVESVG